MLFVFSCSNDDENTLISEQTVSSTEVKTILDTDTHSSVLDEVITDLFESSASGKSSKTDDCYVTEYSSTGYSVTFDDCSVNGSDNITGSLTVTYEIGEESNTYTATFNNIATGGIVINGTRSFTLTSDSEDANVTFNIVSDMRIKLADDSVIEELGSKNFTFTFNATSLETSSLTIDGNWTVKSDGNTYIVNITTPLKSSYFNCTYIGEGVMSLNKNGLGVIVDFGDGTCDDIAELTYPNGTTEEISLKDI